MAKYAVIGIGRLGYTIATILAENGMDVIAIDKNKDLIDEISGKVTTALCIDSTDESALRSLGLNEVDAVIIGIGTRRVSSPQPS